MDAEYALKYKKTAGKLSLGLMIFVLIMGAVIVGFGLFFIIYFLTQMMITLGSIMCVVGILDAVLAVRFYQVTKKRIAKISDKEAIERYKRIHGIK